MSPSHADRLRLLAGQIANLNWVLDGQFNKGVSDKDLGPLRAKINKLLGRYQQGREYYNCSAPDYESDEEEYIWADFNQYLQQF